MKSSRIVKLALFVIVVFGSVKTAFADISYSFTTIDVPGASNGTQVYGINDSGQIVGFYGTIEPPQPPGDHGFLYTGGSFTTINVPGATNTITHGINDSGQIVGQSSLGAFLDTAGSFTSIDVLGAQSTVPYGINDSGQIVGYYQDSSGVHGFHDTGGSFTTIDVPGAQATFARAINNSGQIAGVYIISGMVPHGFLATPECPPPLISGASASPNVLWPPNHQFVDVAINYVETSNCTSTCTLSVASNEPGPDEWIIVDAHHVQLLAERNGNGSGRVYTITITCTSAGGTSTKAVTVLVPHDQGSLSTRQRLTRHP